MPYLPLGQAVLLERIGGKFYFHFLPGTHQSGIFVAYPDFALHRVVQRHQRHDHGTRPNDTAYCVRGKVLHGAVQRRPEFKQLMALRQLVEFLLHAMLLRLGFHAFVVKLLAISRSDLGRALFALLDSRCKAFNVVLLRLEVLLFLDTLTLLVKVEHASGEAVPRQLVVGPLLFAVDRHCSPQLGLQRLAAAQILLRFCKHRLLRIQRIQIGLAARAILRLHLRMQGRRIAGQ